MASKFAGPKSNGLPCLGGNVGGLYQAPSKAEDDRRTQENAADNQGHPASWTIDKAVNEFPKRLKASVEAEGGHFEHLQLLLNSDALLSCLNNVILLSLLEYFLMR